MTGIGIAKAAGLVVVLCEEEGCKSAVGRILVEEAIYREQEALRLFQNKRHVGAARVAGALVSEMRLEIGHQESCRDSFAANIADHQAKLIAAEIEKIVIIATYVAGLDANGCVFQGGKSRMGLWEEPRLDVPGELQFLAQAMFGFRPLGMGAALCLNLAVDRVITQKREGVSIGVFKSGRDCAPRLHLRRMVKTHALLAPFLELGEDVFGQEDDLSRAADKLVFIGAGFRSNEREHGGAIGGSDGERIFDGPERNIKGQAESQLIQVESPAALLVANENGNGSEAEVGVVAIRLKTAPVRK